MPLPQIYFSRQEVGERLGLDDDTLSYWARNGLIRAENDGGGKGRHRRFSRLELGLAAVLAKLRTFGLSSAALAALATEFHSAVDWMTKHGLDGERSKQVDRLVQARARFEQEGEFRQRWAEYLNHERADEWFDLRNRDVRLAETVAVDEWRRHERLFRVLADIALESPSLDKGPLRLVLNENGTWDLLESDEAADFISLSINGLAAQVWRGER